MTEPHCKAGAGGVSWMNVCRMPTVCATLRQEGASGWEQNWPTLVKTGLKGVCALGVRVMDSIPKGWERGKEKSAGSFIAVQQITPILVA